MLADLPLVGLERIFQTRPSSGRRVQNWHLRTSLEFSSLCPNVIRPTSTPYKESNMIALKKCHDACMPHIKNIIED